MVKLGSDFGGTGPSNSHGEARRSRNNEVSMKCP